jgi:hypothetical protein
MGCGCALVLVRSFLFYARHLEFDRRTARAAFRLFTDSRRWCAGGYKVGALSKSKVEWDQRD